MPREHPRPGQDQIARLRASQEAESILQDARNNRPTSQTEPPPFVDRHIAEPPDGATITLTFHAASGRWLGVMVAPGFPRPFESHAKTARDCSTNLMTRFAREARRGRNT